jgi:Uma2 family endonuclease
MTTIRHGTKMTLAEYRDLPPSEGVWELADGVLCQMAPPTYDHQNLITFLVEFINAYLNTTIPRQGWAIPGIGVALSELHSPTPDLVYVRSDRVHLIQGSFVEGVPDLVVEVLSTDRARDLVMKRTWYEEAGVPEYWVMDPTVDSITVLELNGSEYVERATLRTKDTLISRAIPGFTLPLARLFNHSARTLPGRQE